MAKNFVANIFGGQILLIRGGLVKNWKFVIYIFILATLYVSIHFGVKETLLTESRNSEVIKNLKSEYTGKYARLLYLSKRNEVERMLLEKGSSLKAPVVPPKRVNDVR